MSSPGRRRLRLRRWGRRLFVGLSVAVLAGAMVTAVERGGEARRLSEGIGRLEQEQAMARSRLAAAMRRVDSLTSRERIARAAARIGLRPASDEEITFLRASAEQGHAGEEDR